MRKGLLTFSALAFVVLGVTCATADTKRTRELVKSGEVTIDVIVEGNGPVVVMLPSRGRDSEDYDVVAQKIAAAGFRVLRPQPRGVGASRGPMQDVTLHDFARDIAAVIEAQRSGPAVIVGHAYGNWVARMTAVDFPQAVRGIVLAAAAAKKYPPELSDYVSKSADMSLSEAERLKYLKLTFFAPGNDPSEWLHGWYEDVSQSQRLASQKTKQEEWWSGGKVPLLDLQADQDPFKTPAQRDELKAEFGDRVSIAVVSNASHALLPEQPQAVADAIVAWIKKL
ncbi:MULTISPECIES: alpha/beta hydrolase [unclassified Beijerinckia]|uniref:alpha/beta fold hydrolase n=1 Tax=unclassified Beijerinckia TaxID=2638183 RepID=UPI00089C6CE6|nr:MULTISPECIES: alpha/beta hydrolase [unclassified Beijerinckia]MDH7797087.1 pimeloyl-ACP methyl ester carboxylesterase [Beijerinckia sp. GAS462]SEC71722.1 Pimeloyl-ACP methyl ester carboxylesterase [Beijerinckia sp. 28-YEA-48]